jgi:hypothetical protein
MSNPRETVLRVLKGAKGDDSYRAKMAFRNLSPEQMAKEYGESGKTHYQIIQEYEAHDKKIEEAIKWVTKVKE